MQPPAASDSSRKAPCHVPATSRPAATLCGLSPPLPARGCKPHPDARERLRCGPFRQQRSFAQCVKTSTAGPLFKTSTASPVTHLRAVQAPGSGEQQGGGGAAAWCNQGPASNPAPRPLSPHLAVATVAMMAFLKRIRARQDRMLSCTCRRAPAPSDRGRLPLS